MSIVTPSIHQHDCFAPTRSPNFYINSGSLGMTTGIVALDYGHLGPDTSIIPNNYTMGTTPNITGNPYYQQTAAQNAHEIIAHEAHGIQNPAHSQATNNYYQHGSRVLRHDHFNQSDISNVLTGLEEVSTALSSEFLVWMNTTIRQGNTEAMWISDDTYPEVIYSTWRPSHFTNPASHLDYDPPLHVHDPIVPKIWHVKSSPRALNFTWKCYQDFTPTRAKISTHITIPTTSCPICNYHNDTLHHMLLEGPFTRACWYASKWSFQLDRVRHLSPQTWIRIWLSPSKNWGFCLDAWSTFCVDITWLIWKERCKAAFEKKIPNIARIMQIAKSTQASKSLTTHHTISLPVQSPPLTQHTTSPLWQPPKPPFLKMNIEASFIIQTLSFGIGFIMRDSHRNVLAAGTWTGHATTVEEAECRGVLLATQWALERQLTHLELEIDDQAISVEWVTRSSSDLSQLILYILILSFVAVT
ncbi:hypothetical protein IFM89_029911 [Coptis chinensis]|uniref:RNase H type-1 domain-containing protein n=1 Tax=Coptis chinensis TaxID=261450 RepID=A0A835LT83_9MAGN|nr:hypothetical protein IFM89_029911 [Coptis chinensis]